VVLGRDADAGIAHPEPHPHRIRARPTRQFDGDGDPALVGELDRVADEIRQHLAQMPAVAVHPPRHVGMNLGHQPQPLALRLRAEHRQHVADDFVQIEIHRNDGHLVGFDPRQVEDVVDQREQRAARAADGVHHIPHIE
jgi:hypothetical protein